MTEPRCGAKGENDRAGRDRYAALFEDRLQLGELNAVYDPLETALNHPVDLNPGDMEKVLKRLGDAIERLKDDVGSA